MPRIVSVTEVRNQLGEILDRVNLMQEQYIIEKRGRPVAAIVPVSLLAILKTEGASQVVSENMRTPTKKKV
jgi:prevent-host-death family protein